MTLEKKPVAISLLLLRQLSNPYTLAATTCTWKPSGIALAPLSCRTAVAAVDHAEPPRITQETSPLTSSLMRINPHQKVITVSSV